MSELTRWQKRIRIAEACGWRVFESGADGIFARPPEGKLPEWADMELPDYFGSLDAMHEAEKVLTEEQKKIYTAHLHPKELHHYLMADFLVCHATATQRTEAFGKTLNLW